MSDDEVARVGRMDALGVIRAGWDAAAGDAMFNILTIEGKQGGGWDTEEFFGTGDAEIEGLLKLLDELEVLHSRRRALDFGCGVGRLTQALAWHFDYVMGVDVSPAMIELAGSYHFGGNYEFMVTGETLHGVDGAFDLIYSMITLQHMAQELQRGYVREFVRLLALGGVAAFQIPEGDGLLMEAGHLSMHGATSAQVAEWVAPGRIVAQEVCDQGAFPGWLYVVTQ